MRVMLASGSRYRRELVARSGFEVECVAPPYDEEAAKAALGYVTVEAMVRALARGKAESLARTAPDALVIGSDQAGEIDGHVLGKPGTVDAARAQLARLAGREHRLLTAVCVVHGASGRSEEALEVHTMAMRALSPAQIAEYVRRDAPLDCAGSYRVESLGAALFERMAGEDFTAIVGLPLTRVVSLLERFGLSPFAPAAG